MIVCPHCKAQKIFTSKVPKDMIVVLPCPVCHELVVLFQNRVLAVSRRIIERGTFEERKTHFASLIAEFLEQGPPFLGLGEAKDHMPDDLNALAEELMERGESGRSALRQSSAGPITQEELDQFIRVDLRRIDDSDYFRKNLN